MKQPIIGFFAAFFIGVSLTLSIFAGARAADATPRGFAQVLHYSVESDTGAQHSKGLYPTAKPERHSTTPPNQMPQGAMVWLNSAEPAMATLSHRLASLFKVFAIQYPQFVSRSQQHSLQILLLTALLSDDRAA